MIRIPTIGSRNKEQGLDFSDYPIDRRREGIILVVGLILTTTGLYLSLRPFLIGLLGSALSGVGSYAMVIGFLGLYLSREHNTYREVMEELVSWSKSVESPGKWLSEFRMWNMVGFPLSVVVGVVLSLTSGENSAGVLGAVVVPFTWGLPWLRAFDRRNNLKSGIDRELPVASLLMWGVSQLSFGLLRIVDALKDELDLIPNVAREFTRINRDVVVFRIEPEEAVQERVKDHPSRTFSKLLGGAISISKSGGDLALFLDRMTEEIIEEMRNAWERFGRAAANLGELSMMFILMVPMLAVWFALAQGQALYGMYAIAFFVLPLVGVGLYMYLAFQPSREVVSVSGNLKLGLLLLALGAVVDVLLFLVGQRQAWELIEPPLLGLTFGYGWQVHKTIRKKNDLEYHLPIFIRALSEHIRSTGDNLYMSMKKLRGTKAFGKGINEVINRYLELSQVTVNVKEMTPDMPSWIVRSMFTTLVSLDREGTLSYSVMRRLVELSDKFYDAVNTRKTSMMTFIGTSIMAPALLVGVMAIIVYAMVSISGSIQIPQVQTTSDLGFSQFSQFQNILGFVNAFSNIRQTIQEILPIMEVMVVEVGVIYGVLLSKASDSTVKNTFRVFEVSLVALVSVVALQLVLPFITGGSI